MIVICLRCSLISHINHLVSKAVLTNSDHTGSAHKAKGADTSFKIFIRDILMKVFPIF